MNNTNVVVPPAVKSDVSSLENTPEYQDCINIGKKIGEFRMISPSSINNESLIGKIKEIQTLLKLESNVLLNGIIDKIQNNILRINISNIVNIFMDSYNKTCKEVISKIEKQKIEQEKIRLKQIKEAQQQKKQKEEEENKKRKPSDTLEQPTKKQKTETGSIDISEETATAWKINRLVAKSVLKFCNICQDYNGTINSNFVNGIQNDYLKLEIEILYNIGYQQRLRLVELASGNLDDKLEAGFIENIQQNNTLLNQKVYILHEEDKGYPNVPVDKSWSKTITDAMNQNKLFYINNATTKPISIQKKELDSSFSFCPASSILDGMSQCSYNSALSRIEYGDMNFQIIANDQNKSVYHQGILKINNQSANKISVTVTTQTLFPDNTLLNSSVKNVDLKTGIELNANVVYRSQVETIYTIFSGLIKEYPQGILTKNLNSLLWNRLQNNIELCKQILQKGSLKSCGDLFQEINTCTKNGAYTKFLNNLTNLNNPTSSQNTANLYKVNIQNKQIIEYNLNGNALRVCLCNDRPSGLRIVFTLLFADSANINQLSLGGYCGPNSKIIAVSRPQLTIPVNSSKLKKKGGTMKKKKNPKKKQMTRKKKNAVSSKNPKNKTISKKPVKYPKKTIRK